MSVYCHVPFPPDINKNIKLIILISCTELEKITGPIIKPEKKNLLLFAELQLEREGQLKHLLRPRDNRQFSKA